ncbi:unnamed protein product, partial [Rotaria sordida]
MNLSKRLAQKAVKGWIHGIRTFHQFDPLAVNRISC